MCWSLVQGRPTECLCLCVWHINLKRRRPSALLGHWATNTEQSVGLSTHIISLYQNFCRCNTTSVSVHIHFVNKRYIYRCPRRNVPDFGRVFLMLNYTYITQNTRVQSRTVTEIIAREKCGLHRSRRTVRRPWLHTCPLRLPDNETL